MPNNEMERRLFEKRLMDVEDATGHRFQREASGAIYLEESSDPEVGDHHCYAICEKCGWATDCVLCWEVEGFEGSVIDLPCE